MSIISSALKKVQDERGERKTSPASSATQTFSQGQFQNSTIVVEKIRPSEDTAARSLKLLLLMAAVCVIALFVAISIKFYPDLFGKKNDKNMASPGITAGPVKTAQPPAAPSHPSAKPADKSALERTPSVVIPDPGNAPLPEKLPYLNGIMYTPTRPQAVINGIMLYEGDPIEGYTVKNILPESVKLVSDGKEYELKLR